MQSSLLKTLWPHGLAILIFLILSCIFFSPQLENKVVSQPDIRSWEATSHEILQYEEETGRRPLWTNSIFSGMPAYQIGIAVSGNLLEFLKDLLALFINRPIGVFISACICFYILLIAMGTGPWLGMLGAIGFAYTTNNVLLFATGHNTKLLSLIFLAPVIAGTILVFRKKYLTGGVLYSIFLALAILAGHYQMVYYLFILLGLLALFELYRAIRGKAVIDFLKAAGILVLGTALAAGTSASKLLTTAEYARDTMRGAPILEENQYSTASSSETEGLAWDYAMRWSNGVKDVLATLIPRASGGGSQELVNEESNVYKDFRNRGINVPKELNIPLYHGDQPFTSGPIYFGAIFVFLFLLGALYVNGQVKWWLVAATVVSVLMSMGSEFALLNKPLFDYFPMFNKFRAPSSVLGVTALLIPLLGMLGLHKLFKGDLPAEKTKKGLYLAAGITGGLCILVALLGPSLMQFTSPNDQNYLQAGFSQEALIDDRIKYLRLDAIRSAAIIFIAAFILYLYTRQRLGKLVAVLLLGAVALFDLWGVGKRYLPTEIFETQREADRYFQMTEVDRNILQDDDPYYRVHDLTRDPWNDSYRAYWHKLIGGYHAAKLQRYQDIIDYYLSKGHKNVLNMLNAKYIIFQDENNQERVQLNSEAFGNAWFVEGIRVVETADEEIEALQNLDPKAQAVIHKEFEEFVLGFDPVKNGTIRLVSYHPEHLVYETTSQSDQLAVFSEVWYGPDKGWRAYLDGQPVDLFRANYILRAMNVPEGKHKIELKFHPETYYKGAAIGYATSGLLLLLLLGAGYRAFRQYQHGETKTKDQGKRPGEPVKKRQKVRRRKRKS